MHTVNKDIVASAKSNDAFRRVLITGAHSQVVLMTLPPEGEIGEEVHANVDQTLVFVEGEGSAILAGETTRVHAGSLAFVPAGTKHNFVNTGPEPLRLYTVYAPPQHAPGTVHQTKADADAAEKAPAERR
ncbi:MAG: cupin domain-containing protein [Actinomycetota bacterium]